MAAKQVTEPSRSTVEAQLSKLLTFEPFNSFTMSEIKYQIIKIDVTSANQKVRFWADTERHYSKVTGLMLSVPYSDIRGSIELNINNSEIFPEDYEIKLLTTTENVAPDDRFYSVVSEAKGSRVEGKLQDNGTSRTYPYTALLYLRLEN